jgi:tripartite-type tricarboxylate transporter receptor subunit TctC
MDTEARRRRLLVSLASLTAAPFLVTTARAQPDAGTWPSKPIRLIVPFPPGGATDIVARTVGQRLSDRFRQIVVVENRPGASGSLAAMQVAQSEPDGHTLMMLGTPTLLAPLLYKAAAYDPAKFTQIATMYDIPLVLVVNPGRLPTVTDLQGFIAHVKSQHTPLNYTTAGIGSFGHLSMELLMSMAGTKLQHVPQRGGQPAITDTIAGHVPVMFADLNAALPHIRAGSLRAIGVASEQRVSMLPDIQTIAEQGVEGFSVTAWGGMLAPPGTPKRIAEGLTSEIDKILSEPQVREKFLGLAVLVNFEAGEKMRLRILQDFARWGPIVRGQKIALD